MIHIISCKHEAAAHLSWRQAALPMLAIPPIAWAVLCRHTVGAAISRPQCCGSTFGKVVMQTAVGEL
ncbi:MAG: hypothetical protein MRZ66_02710 [Clostridiales bacterium]|nr:hypothetical protein [Clostridiales bacterium]